MITATGSTTGPENLQDADAPKTNHHHSGPEELETSNDYCTAVPTWLPLPLQEWVPLIGAFMFGTVVAWMAHHVLHKAEQPDAKWLASMIAVIGGGAVTALFEPSSILFGAYCIGLALAFFARAGLTRCQSSSRERTTSSKRRPSSGVSGLGLTQALHLGVAVSGASDFKFPERPRQVS